MIHTRGGISVLCRSATPGASRPRPHAAERSRGAGGGQAVEDPQHSGGPPARTRGTLSRTGSAIMATLDALRDVAIGQARLGAQMLEGATQARWLCWCRSWASAYMSGKVTGDFGIFAAARSSISGRVVCVCSAGSKNSKLHARGLFVPCVPVCACASAHVCAACCTPTAAMDHPVVCKPMTGTGT